MRCCTPFFENGYNAKQEEEERYLAILYPRCTRTNPQNEFPLNVIEVFLSYEQNHSTDKCPSLLGLKFVSRWGSRTRVTMFHKSDKASRA